MSTHLPDPIFSMPATAATARPKSLQANGRMNVTTANNTRKAKATIRRTKML